MRMEEETWTKLITSQSLARLQEVDRSRQNKQNTLFAI